MTSSELRVIEAYEAALLVPRAREFFAEGKIPGTFNEQHWVTSLFAGISEGRMVVVGAGMPVVRGAIGAVIYPDMSTGDKCAAELFWFVGREERGSVGLKLFKVLEGALTRLAVERLYMWNLAHDDDADLRLDQLYRRWGYTLQERVYMKEFTT